MFTVAVEVSTTGYTGLADGIVVDDRTAGVGDTATAFTIFADVEDAVAVVGDHSSTVGDTIPIRWTFGWVYA